MSDESLRSSGASQDRALRRFRWFATSLLGLAAVVFILASRVADPSLAVQFIEAAAEAGLVGGLADWFAVTAIFRRPLGLPIPHTAVIPANKERIGTGLAAFIEHNFLDPDLIGDKVRSLDPATRAAQWLADPERSRLLADRLVALLPYAVERIEDRQVRAFVVWALRQELDSFEPAPLLGKLIDVLRQSHRHSVLFDYLVGAMRDLLHENEALIHEIVEDRSRWWVPRRVDRRVSEAVVRGVAELLEDLCQRDHQVRIAYEEWLDRLSHDLKTSETLQAQVREGFRKTIRRREVQTYTSAVWAEVRQRLLADLGSPNSAIRNALASGLCSMGEAVLQDAAMRDRLNARAEEVTRTMVLPWRGEIGRFVADVVRSWETASIVERMERIVGRDLQYIRINGTIVGALVGAAIFALSHLL